MKKSTILHLSAGFGLVICDLCSRPEKCLCCSGASFSES